MLLNSFSHIALGILDGFPIAQATGQSGTISQVPIVLGFFLNHDLERIKLHKPSSPKAQSIVAPPYLDRFFFFPTM